MDKRGLTHKLRMKNRFSRYVSSRMKNRFSRYVSSRASQEARTVHFTQSRIHDHLQTWTEVVPASSMLHESQSIGTAVVGEASIGSTFSYLGERLDKYQFSQLSLNIRGDQGVILTSSSSPTTGQIFTSFTIKSSPTTDLKTGVSGVQEQEVLKSRKSILLCDATRG